MEEDYAMSIADDILIPHTSEVLLMLRKKRFDRFEYFFPGLLENVMQWLVSDEFEKQALDYCYVIRGFAWPRCYAPSFVLQNITKMFAGTCYVQLTDVQDIVLHSMCDTLWLETMHTLRDRIENERR